MAFRHLFGLISSSAIVDNKPSGCIKSQLLFFTLLLTSALWRLTTNQKLPKTFWGPSCNIRTIRAVNSIYSSFVILTASYQNCLPSGRW